MRKNDFDLRVLAFSPRYNEVGSSFEGLIGDLHIIDQLRVHVRSAPNSLRRWEARAEGRDAEWKRASESRVKTRLHAASRAQPRWVHKSRLRHILETVIRRRVELMRVAH